MIYLPRAISQIRHYLVVIDPCQKIVRKFQQSPKAANPDPLDTTNNLENDNYSGYNMCAIPLHCLLTLGLQSSGRLSATPD